MTAKIINLGKVRKSKARDAKETQASANREKFGRTKIERTQTQAERSRTANVLDGAKLTSVVADQGSPTSVISHDSTDSGPDPGATS
jgi:DICT domain-containing protein